jgi:hypothetical protein
MAIRPKQKDIPGPTVESALAKMLRLGSMRAPAFEARVAELASQGIPAGALLAEFPLLPEFPDRIARRHYKHLTLIVRDGQLLLVRGPIRDKWEALGGPDWGVPAHDETPTGLGDGRHVTFDLLKPGVAGGGLKAAILWSGVTGAGLLAGAVYESFMARGGVHVVGYPTDGGTVPALPDNNGWICRFRRAFLDDVPSAICVPGKGLAAYHVYGGIHRLWASMGGHASPLGFPKSDEFGTPGAERRQYFDDGTVVWRPESGAFVEMEPWHIRYRGLRVVRTKGDESSANVEFYAFAAAMPRVPGDGTRTTKLPPNAAEYAHLRTGRWRGDDVVVYAGTADSLVLALSGAERDRGDPNAYLPAIEGVTKKAVEVVVTALGGLLGGVGAKLGALAGKPLSEVLGKEIASAINDVLGTGDDAFDPRAVPLNLATIRAWLAESPALAQARNADGGPAEPFPYHFTADLTGNGHWIELYFEVRRGLP